LMICRLCGNNKFQTIYHYMEPDKYEQSINISGGRSWLRCTNCRFFVQHHTYDPIKFTEAYIKTYRSAAFRNETIADTYLRISRKKNNENSKRLKILSPYIRGTNMMDFGSGFGLWPASLNHNVNVDCVEINEDSVRFINDSLGMACHVKIPDRKYNTISCIHTLEHIKDPERLLSTFRKHLYKDGILLLEVPDSDEFKYLDRDNDEFNSCHLYFFSVPNLYQMVTWCGFTVKRIECVHHQERNLKRILLVAENAIEK